jgi:hypothetical protein
MSIDRKRRRQSCGPQGAFDPDFDDTQWTDAWLRIPLALPPVTIHRSGYRIGRQLLERVEIFGQAYRLSAPFDCRLLFDPAGRLWMSNTPQEHMMMYNNAARSWGHVLVGGLGLGLYPQYALAGVAGQATGFTIIECSPIVRELVEPVLRAVLDVPLEVRTAGIEEYLAGSTGERFDTIFLDTWDTLDAANLPAINRLRELARPYVSPGGRLLLWGYRWMVRLFEDACRRLLAVDPLERPAWLEAWIEQTASARLLGPVAERFSGRTLDAESIDDALLWCRSHIIAVRGN